MYEPVEDEADDGSAADAVRASPMPSSLRRGAEATRAAAQVDLAMAFDDDDDEGASALLSGELRLQQVEE